MGTKQHRCNKCSQLSYNGEFRGERFFCSDCLRYHRISNADTYGDKLTKEQLKAKQVRDTQEKMLRLVRNAKPISFYTEKINRAGTNFLEIDTIPYEHSLDWGRIKNDYGILLKNKVNDERLLDDIIKYRVDDEGYYLTITNIQEGWSTGRSLWRVNKGILSTMIGDLIEGGMPEKHLKIWAEKNLNPDEVKVLDYYSDFRNSIKRMIHFMKELNLRVKNLMKGVFEEDINEDLFLLEGLENELSFVKKFIDKETPITDFQSRIIFLNTIINEKINTNLIINIFDKFDNNIKYLPERRYIREIIDNCEEADKSIVKDCSFLKEPLKGLNLFRKFIFFLRINYEIINSFKIRSKKELSDKKDKIKEKIGELFEDYYLYNISKKDFKNLKFCQQIEESIAENTKHLKALNKFRSGSSAHGFNQKEFEKALKKFGIDEKTKDFSIILTEIINKVGRDIERIFFELMPFSNPFIENYRDAVKSIFVELSKKKDKYEYDFEELYDCYSEFPELIEESIKTLKEIFDKKKEDEIFLVYLGLFLENLSMTSPRNAQELVYMILEKMKKVPSDVKFCIAHIGHIIKNSKELKDDFVEKIKPAILDNLSKGGDEGYMAQWCIWALKKQFPEIAKTFEF